MQQPETKVACSRRGHGNHVAASISLVQAGASTSTRASATFDSRGIHVGAKCLKKSGNSLRPTVVRLRHVLLHGRPFVHHQIGLFRISRHFG